MDDKWAARPRYVPHHDHVKKQSSGASVPFLKWVNSYQLHVSPDSEPCSSGSVLRTRLLGRFPKENAAEVQHLRRNLCVVGRKISHGRKRIDVDLSVLTSNIWPSSRENQAVQFEDVGETHGFFSLGDLLGMLKGKPQAAIDLGLVLCLFFGVAAKGQC